jgi:hypothetical protein
VPDRPQAGLEIKVRLADQLPSTKLACLKDLGMGFVKEFRRRYATVHERDDPEPNAK